MKSRSESLRSIAGQSFDVCVIGGGATGSGCALDSQLRGFRTVQLEAGDYASSTSGASTKMAHGGVRYLEEAIRGFDPKEYAVLRRALHERIRMLRNAPFLTTTKQFITPCFRRIDIPYFEIGLKLYDWIAGRDALAPSRYLSRDETLRLMPALAADRLVGSVTYTDGQFDDARYNITLVKTFTAAGGETLNYARVIALEKAPDGKLQAAEVEDQLTHARFTFRARAFINATGPYADTVRQMAMPAALPRMRLSKGIHILLPLEVLASEDALLVPNTEDGRVLFAIPWHGRLLVGTTDDEAKLADELFVKKEEVAYVLRQLNKYLAQPATANQIVSGTAGLRPLVSSGNAAETKRLARDHEVEVDRASGLVSIMGGKWTTHRAMAEDTLNAVQKYLGDAGRKCSTLSHPLLGSDGYGPEYWQLLAARYALTEPTARHLAGKYGVCATDVLKLAEADPDLARPILDGLAPIRAQVVFGARDELAASIEDILARRIGLQLYGWRDAIRAAPAVAELLARELRWPEAAERQAIAEYVAKIQGLIGKAGI
ncbi:MAG: glycerol-3-phosphate dehydrogenase/oxidase [Candidatus Acidiferrales bacterium]|jgi:glycerol-3-phosphate dehydrogenase